jgi:hypothetical protein
MPLEQIATCDYSVGAVSNALSGTELPSLTIARSIAAIGGCATSLDVHKIWFGAATTVFVDGEPGAAARHRDPRRDARRPGLGPAAADAALGHRPRRPALENRAPSLGWSGYL